MIPKTIRSGLAALALLAAPMAAQTAQAADFSPAYKAPPAYVAPVFSWTGFYLGLNGGYTWAKTRWDVPPGVDWDVDGFMGGLTVGYNFQTGFWVWGLEGDIDYSSIKKSHACLGGGSCEFKNDWFGTARGRIGYAGWHTFMPYITGGAAFADVEASNSGVPGSKSDVRFGWTLGGGFEYALYRAWSIKAEYLYADLGKMDCGTACGAAATDNVTYKANILRAGVNYRF